MISQSLGDPLMSCPLFVIYKVGACSSSCQGQSVSRTILLRVNMLEHEEDKTGSG